MDHTPRSLAPGQEHEMADRRHVIRPFPTARSALLPAALTEGIEPAALQVHPVPSQGYTVLSRKQKLRPEWVGAAGPDIAAARRRGEVVTDAVEVPEVAFTGDTSMDWIHNPAAGEGACAGLHSALQPAARLTLWRPRQRCARGCS